ncbi:MAG: PQQ-like beta-propeller repeat protein, partial [Acidobacteria bacterium]|nr:PQQ-like beta-propeller repeat protein [Acidobacteriota bacterium]
DPDKKEQTKPTTVLNSVDVDSGLSNWFLDLSEFENTPDSEFYLLSDEQFLYVLNRGGQLFAIDKKDKTISWRKTVETSLSSKPVISGGMIAFGTTNKTIIEISRLNGEITTQIPLGFVPSSLAASTSHLFAGSKKGDLSAISRQSLSASWTGQTGGEIVDLKIVGNDLLASSNDNFVYRFSGDNGSKIWKRKMSGRILGNTIVNQNLSIVLSVGSSEAVLIDLSNGKIVNRIGVSDADYFLSAPVSIGNKMILPTNIGLGAYSPLCGA